MFSLIGTGIPLLRNGYCCVYVFPALRVYIGGCVHPSNKDTLSEFYFVVRNIHIRSNKSRAFFNTRHVGLHSKEEKHSMSTDKDLGAQGQEDSLKGKMDQAAGKVQKKVGQVTGDNSTEAKGKVRETGGKVEEKGGQLEQNVDNTLKNS